MRDLYEELTSDLVSRANGEDDPMKDRCLEAASELLSLAKGSQD